jgi:small-conductance mechanosensitive channel
MEAFFEDVYQHILSYYELLVALLPKLILGVAVLILFWIVAGQIRRFIRKRLLIRMDDPLQANFIARSFKIVFVLLGFLGFLQIVGLGKAASSLLAGAGISAFILGFAFKDIGENFLAGLLMAFKRPFRIGDIVQVGDIEGKIIGLSLRDTQIKTFDGKDVYVPNAMIVKNPIINYTIDGFLRDEFTIGLDYGSDLSKAMDIMLAQVKQIPDILSEDKAPSVLISELGSSTINLTTYYWLDTFDPKVSRMEVKNRVIDSSLTALDHAGFNLPGDIIELKNYKGESLRTG